MKDKRILTVSMHNGCTKPVGRLFLAGSYLEKYGFHINDQVEVRYIEPGKLTITKLNSMF